MKETCGTSNLRKRYTRIRKWDGGYVACLTVGCQTFTIAQVGTRAEARWMRDMLAKALENLVKQEKGGGK
jgi:hypothetical protein